MLVSLEVVICLKLPLLIWSPQMLDSLVCGPSIVQLHLPLELDQFQGETSLQDIGIILKTKTQRAIVGRGVHPNLHFTPMVIFQTLN